MTISTKLSITLWKWMQDLLFSHRGSLIHWNTARAASRVGRTPGFQRSLQQHHAFKSSSCHHLTHPEDHGSVDTWPVIAAASLSATPEESNFSLEHIQTEKQNTIQRTRNVSPGSAQLPFFSGRTLSLAMFFISPLGSQTTNGTVLLQTEVNVAVLLQRKVNYLYH